MAHQVEYNEYNKAPVSPLVDSEDAESTASTEDEDEAPPSTGPTEPEIKANVGVWAPMVVRVKGGGTQEGMGKAIFSKRNKGNPQLCTVIMKDVRYSDLTRRGKKRTRPQARAQPGSPAHGAAAAAVNEVPLDVPLEVPLEVPIEVQRPTKKPKLSEPEPPPRKIARILVIEDKDTAQQLLGNLQSLKCADLFVAAKPGVMDRKLDALPKGSFREVALVTKTTKKQKVPAADLREIHALVAKIMGVAAKDLLCAIAFDSDTFADEGFMCQPNVVLLDTVVVAKYGLPKEMQTLVESPEYAKLSGTVTPPVRTPTKVTTKVTAMQPATKPRADEEPEYAKLAGTVTPPVQTPTEVAAVVKPATKPRADEDPVYLSGDEDETAKPPAGDKKKSEIVVLSDDDE